MVIVVCTKMGFKLLNIPMPFCTCHHIIKSLVYILGSHEYCYMMSKTNGKESTYEVIIKFDSWQLPNFVRWRRTNLVTWQVTNWHHLKFVRWQRTN